MLWRLCILLYSSGIVGFCSIKQLTCLNSNDKLCLPYRVWPLITLLSIFQLPTAAVTALPRRFFSTFITWSQPKAWEEFILSFWILFSLRFPCFPLIGQPRLCSLIPQALWLLPLCHMSCAWVGNTYSQKSSKFTYCIWCSFGFQEHIPLSHLPAISLSPFEPFLHTHSLAISQKFG